LSPTVQSIKCLVRSAVSGLIEEDCPAGSTGCRIQFEESVVLWYQSGHLYDRNQLVCIRPKEYSTPQGCHRKPSGSIRCWCTPDSPQAACNTELASLELLTSFLYPPTTSTAPPTTTSTAPPPPPTTPLPSPPSSPSPRSTTAPKKAHHHHSHSNSHNHPSRQSLSPSPEHSSTAFIAPSSSRSLPPISPSAPSSPPSPPTPRASRRMGVRHPTTESPTSLRSLNRYSPAVGPVNAASSFCMSVIPLLMLLRLNFRD
ncbi:hypothetical protein PFISCL1PPCAC_18448, partial [Pristionchus fissidentatus]